MTVEEMKDKMKNYMTQVADILGVEMDESFAVYKKDLSYLGMYKITERGLMDYDVGIFEKTLLTNILTGECTIKKIWNPKIGEKFYIPTIDSNKTSLCFNRSETSDLDNLYFKRGMICKTREQATELAEVALEAIKKYRIEKGV